MPSGSISAKATLRRGDDAGRLTSYRILLPIQTRSDRVTPIEDWLQKTSKPTVCRYVFQRHGKRIKDFHGSWDAACKAVGLAG